MKGVVFTEFIEMVEDRLGPETADRIIEEARLASGGAYTAVGTYDYRELVALTRELSAATGQPGPELVREFGRHLFGRFAVAYPQFFAGVEDALSFLAGIEDHIHVEVHKLDPDAELPRFDCTRHGKDRLDLVYRSPRPFADFAEGLLVGCAEHFGEELEIAREAAGPGAVRFRVTREVSSLVC